ncbi:MAG: ArsR/SmtB family transcription factor, partial [Myxococcaceae bacterium]
MSPSIRHRARDPSPVFAALGDRTRMALVRRLSSEGALSVTALTEGTRISRQAVTKHL